MDFEALRTRILEQFPSMGVQLRQAAQYALDNPSEVAVSSVRKLAEAAGVKPNAFMRLAGCWASMASRSSVSLTAIW
jgi:DNA-binding MurR/RpiR family transcriptional regulator